jgi:uncharacterized protein (TIGR03790 family)
VEEGRRAIFLAVLVLFGSTNLNPNQEVDLESDTSLFQGFSILTDVWNETPFNDVASSNGFNYSNVIDYSDVGVLINNRSEISRTIGWAFVTARNISADRIFIFDNESTPTGETINRDQFDTYFESPFRLMLQNYNGTDLNYLVTTKGVPLRINGGNNKASFDQEISLIGGDYDGDINSDYWGNHGYGPLAGKQMDKFTRDDYGFFLVTRLTGYTVDTAIDLIEKANQSYGSRGVHVLDLATNRNTSGYQFWNDDLYIANSTLNGTYGHPVYFDEETEFRTNYSNVIGYASWGSNDGNWNKNYLVNGGFETSNSSWTSGSEYWNAHSPIVATGEEFSWEYQTNTTQGGNNAMEAIISAECNQESGNMKAGILAEYFDNEGLSFSSASMPDLIDRVPDHVRIENNLAYTSSGNPYPGLDDRFKHNWGARFSGLIDVPESGNWTFYLNTDDGSELWIDGISAIQNYGMHGMREVSATINLTSGYHDFRIEFFQGGGPHGLTFSWQGPNQTKTYIPSSAFIVAGNYVPQKEDLIHHWDFEEGSGNISLDSVTNNSNFTLHGMNSSNWKNCIDGNCLWYDGLNDYAKVDVDDWFGNFTVSQWVWANKTNQTNYAATFAIDNNASSKYSFQHIVYNDKWRLHNNQTKVFGDVRAQYWTHLVTVFDAGNVRQYMDGVLVNSNVYTNGSLNNFDLYKLGVNRGGGAHFEGMIDNVMIWDAALNNSSITSLNRDIVKNCSAYSGNGQNVAYLETTHEIPNDFTNHVWVVYAQGKRSGDVFGEYKIEVSALDSNGTLLSTNISSNVDYTSNWNSDAMRFRPHSDATSFKIRILLDIVPTSTEGSLFVDSAVLRIIRPHMSWINGSITETAVSTGARSFNFGTSYGQSLIADILEDGTSGVKGYVYEPYLTAVSLPSVLFSSYASGYNLAESYAAANTMTSWMGVVVGDPKMSPYADVVHDVDIIDARVTDNVSVNQTFNIEIALQNSGPGEAQGQLLIKDKLGGRELANQTMTIPRGDASGSRLILNLEINSTREGWNNIVISWVANGPLNPERELSNNYHDLVLWVNSYPEIDEIYCDKSQYNRGDRFICGILATDDSQVDTVLIAWRITHNGNSSQWNWLSTGSQDGYDWWTTIEIPSDANLGDFDVRAEVIDQSNMSTFAQEDSIAIVTDAPAVWFGIHVEYVDDSEWGGASSLPTKPSGGITRGVVTLLRACVLDADHNPSKQMPIFVSSRGSIGPLNYQNGDSPEHHCYVANLAVSVNTNLDIFTLELRDAEGHFVTRRNIGVTDSLPEIQIVPINDEYVVLDRLRAGGNERAIIAVNDADDEIDGLYGDLHVTWPGLTTSILALEFINGTAIVDLPLPQEELENGDVILKAVVTGANGAVNSSTVSIPLMLTPPEIVSIIFCNQEGVEIDELMFGTPAIATVEVQSTRPLSSVTASINQFGWSVGSPKTQENCPTANGANELHSFRVQLDSSFVPGNGTLIITATDLDSYSSSSILYFEFLNTPPNLILDYVSNNTAGEAFTLVVEFRSYLGPEGASCTFMLHDTDQNNTTITNQTGSVSSVGEVGFWSTSWFLSKDMNGTYPITLSCVSRLGGATTIQNSIQVSPWDCPDCGESESNNSNKSSSDKSLSSLTAIGLVVLVTFIVTVFYIRARAREDELESSVSWEVDSMPQERDERIPEGWSLEEFQEWINGPIPEEWNEEQWEIYRQSVEDLL